MSLTKTDLSLIQELMKNMLDAFEVKMNLKFAAIDQKFVDQGKFMMETFATKLELRDVEAKLEEKINHLPTKEEFYTTMDNLVGEIRTYRQEHILLGNRVTRLEKKLASTA